MTHRIIAAACSVTLAAAFLTAREVSTPGCGTTLERTRQELYLHRQSTIRNPIRRAGRGMTRAAIAAASTNQDFGNVALVDKSGGVVALQNKFNLNNRSVTFTAGGASASQYTVVSTAGGFDSTAAANGTKLAGLGDDDSRGISLPFPFPFYGHTYRTAYVNSDGNITFVSGDTDITARSFGRMVAGSPRISGLFSDLDPSSAKDSAGVKVYSEAGRVVVTWQSVPQFSDTGFGLPQTFQIQMLANGNVVLAFGTVNVTDAVTGISPGGGTGPTSLVSLVSSPAGEFTGTVADQFSSSDSVDIAVAAQRFYETHDDAYDYLVFFNTVGVAAASGAVAYEVTVRNQRTGYGDEIKENGMEFGSPRRLQSVMNMGPMYQYPDNPAATISARGPTGDTGLSVVGHEAGHLFLAFVSVPNPNNPDDKPMLGRADVHWSFNFDSEASLLEGNTIQDNGEGRSPRFLTTDTVEGYSPLDQYLMGFRAPDEVPPVFAVLNSSSPAARAPQRNISFNGQRLNVAIEDVIAAAGRRTPDSTVAQRKFRFAFVLIAEPGTTPPMEQIQKVDNYRAAFEPYFAKAASNRAVADTRLAHGVQLSLAPAAGVLAGGSGRATIAVSSAVSAPLTFLLSTASGSASVPSSVTIPTGAAEAAFTITGVRAGADDLTATPSDASYETTVAKVQVNGDVSTLSLSLLSPPQVIGVAGSAVPTVRVRVTDVNQVPYAGVRLIGTATTGTVNSSATTDETGVASFIWTPAQDAGTLRLYLEAAPARLVTVNLTSKPAIAANGAVNAASFQTGLTPGSLGTVFGSALSGGPSAAASLPWPHTLAGVQLLIDGTPASLTYVSDTQINFLVPPDLSGSTATIEVQNPAGRSDAFTTQLSALSPAIFIINANNEAAVLIGGTASTTFSRPAKVGDTLEIYATGLGPTVPSTAFPGFVETATKPQILIGGVPAQLVISTVSQFPGLYQINAVVQAGTPSGSQTLNLVMNGIRSNDSKIMVQ